MALADVGRFIEALRRVDRIFDDVRKLQAGQETLEQRVTTIENRLSRLEDREELLVERMSARASDAATAVMNHNLIDMARRLGALEERGRKQIE